MKVYLHFEERDAPHHTLSCEFDEEVTILKDLITNFVKVYNLAYPRFLLKVSNMQLLTREGRKLCLSLSVIDTSISDKDDLMVRVIDGAIIESPAANISVEKPEGAKPATADISKSQRSFIYDESVKFRGEIEKHITEKSYRTARILCREGLTRYPSESYAFFDGLARIKLANSDYDGAIKNSSLAVAAAAKAALDTSLLNFTLASALFSSVDSCDEADEILEKMLLKRFPSSFGIKFTLDVRALRAECLFNLTQHEAAARIVNEHMQWEGAERHLPTLIAYTRFAMAYKKVEEPVRAMLKAIVIDQNNQTCQEMLAELLSTDVGYAELVTQVPLTFASAAAYAFLASAVKECSAMFPCIRLLRDATRLRPQSASFALNLAHALEIMCNYDEAFSVIKIFCSNNATMKVGNQGFSGQMLLLALNGFFPTKDEYSGVQDSATNCYDFSKFKGQHDTAAPVTVEKEMFDKDGLDFIAVAFTAFKIAYLQGNFNVLPALHKLIESTRCSSLEDLHMTSIRNEHAYYQCIVEVLADRAMIINMKHTNSEGKTLADKAQGVEIMEDMINNKSCLGLVCNDTWSMKLSIDKALIEEASARPIYIVGDSHCLSPAWSILHIEGSFHGENRPDDTRLNPVFDSSTDITSEKKKGTPRLLLPRLVTGVKQWHLRPKGNFYTKTNFHQTVRAIPSNAEVIFIVGEIDCREGLLVAVERDRYASLEEGIECTVDIFISVLAKLIATKMFKVFIHPIVPVLKETRPIVMLFNTIYKRKAENLKGAFWLDFFDDLLSADHKNLNAEYTMDGTHLRPNYVSLMEQALQKYFASTLTGATIG